MCEEHKEMFPFHWQISGKGYGHICLVPVAYPRANSSGSRCFGIGIDAREILREETVLDRCDRERHEYNLPVLDSTD